MTRQRKEETLALAQVPPTQHESRGLNDSKTATRRKLGAGRSSRSSSGPGAQSPKQLSDEQLLAQYRRSQDAEVFAELVSRYERELYNYLRRYLGDQALAEDVFQATFLQVHVKRDAFESGRKFRPWLYTIATNQAIDAQRRNRRHKRLSLDRAQATGGEALGSLLEVVASNDADPLQTAQSEEQAAWIRNEVEGLPEPLRRAVNLVYFRGMKYRDAANLMSIPVGTVKSRLHSALQRLGQAWRDMHSPTGL